MNDLKILCVEDDVYAREELVYYLKKIGAKAISAADGVEGLTKWEVHKPDVIIVDLLMPNMDGMTFIRELKAKNCTSRIIVVTSVDTVESILEVVNLGIDYYIVKPLDFSELELKLNCISNMLENDKNPVSSGFDIMENRKTAEDAIKMKFIKTVKDYTGKGPRETVVQMLHDKITITCFGTLTIMEENLLKSSKNFELVKHTRILVHKDLAKDLKSFIEETTGIPVVYTNSTIQLRQRIEQLIFKIKVI